MARNQTLDRTVANILQAGRVYERTQLLRLVQDVPVQEECLVDSWCGSFLSVVPFFLLERIFDLFHPLS